PDSKSSDRHGLWGGASGGVAAALQDAVDRGAADPGFTRPVLLRPSRRPQSARQGSPGPRARRGPPQGETRPPWSPQPLSPPGGMSPPKACDGQQILDQEIGPWKSRERGDALGYRRIDMALRDRPCGSPGERFGVRRRSRCALEVQAAPVVADATT